jgi:hypothetical protein
MKTKNCHTMAGIICLLLMLSTLAEAKIYQYTDKSNNVVLTNSPPAEPQAEEKQMREQVPHGGNVPTAPRLAPDKRALAKGALTHSPAELFVPLQRGVNTLLYFITLIGILSIGARLLVRYMMRDSDRSRTSKRAIENLAAAMVAGVLGMIMLSVLGKAQ